MAAQRKKVSKVKTGMGGTERTALYLVHIIPDVHSTGALGPTPFVISSSVELVQALVPFPAVRIEEVDPSTASAPTPSFELGSMLILNEQIELLRFLINRVILGALDMRVNDHDHLNKKLTSITLGSNQVLTLRARASTSLNMSTGSGKYFLFQIMYL